jgi:hypothetical protein
MPPYYLGDIGFEFRFQIQGFDQVPQQIFFLVDGLEYPCNLPATPADEPTYITTGLEPFPVGVNPAQLKLVYDPATSVIHTSFFDFEVVEPNEG